MKVLIIKTNDTVKAVRIMAQWNNEITFSDLRKLVSSHAEIIYAAKISRLAFIYVLFVEKDANVRPVNMIATLLSGNTERPILGDVVLVRTGHLGAGAKMFALEDDEIAKIGERISKLLGKKVVISDDTSPKR